MEAQEIFDIVVNHARAQKVKCVNDTGVCLYRNEQGLKCFAGALIPDELYEPKMEQKFLHCILSFPSMAHLGLKPHSNLIRDLQKLHDSRDPIINNFLDYWEKGFKHIAEEFYLTYAPPTLETEQ